MLNHRTSSSRRRAGFTLIELLVVISIIATLAALILPAIQNARETARRTECLNHIKNLGVAATSFETARSRLPYLYDGSSMINWGPVASPNPAPSPWTVALLPYLEQGPLADRLATASSDQANANYQTAVLAATKLKIVNCPDDLNSDLPGNLSYCINAGYVQYQMWGASSMMHHHPSLYMYPGATTASDPAQGTGIAWPYIPGDAAATSVPVSVTKVSSNDGTTQTILFTENLQSQNWAGMAPTAMTGADYTWSDYSFSMPIPADMMSPMMVNDNSTPGGIGLAMASGGSLNTSLQLAPTYTSDVKSSPNSLAAGLINSTLVTGEGQAPRPSSLHPGGVNMQFVGGNAKFVAATIDASVYVSLMSWNGSRRGQNILSDTDF
jgi:prepilin-type N-terminal cleavage/methylation domain-containing protein